MKKSTKLTAKKLTEDAYKWLRTRGRECIHITSIFEEERKHDLWYLWPYEETLIFFAGCANLKQNLYKFAKPNASPPSTKVPLGSNVDFNILDNIYNLAQM